MWFLSGRSLEILPKNRSESKLPMIFDDRNHAGKLLAEEISKLNLNLKEVVVAAIPRGGVVVGAAIAKELSIPLAVVVIKKLGAPTNPELAIGAVASHGAPVLDRWLISDLGVSNDFLTKEIRTKKKEALGRENFLGVSLGSYQLEAKVVVVVDDGLATGQTARAASKILRRYKVSQLILAVPCATPSTLELLKNDYDRIISLVKDPYLEAVGQYYRDFRPVEDSEVKELLATSN